MNNKSFSNRLSWRIIGIAAVVFFVSFLAIGLTVHYAITHATDVSVTLALGLNLVIVGLVALAVLYFLCRKEIRRMTRPITELSVSALNMGKGNFKAQLPEITSKDLIDIYIDGEQLPGSQFQLKMLPGALPLRLPRQK